MTEGVKPAKFPIYLAKSKQRFTVLVGDAYSVISLAKRVVDTYSVKSLAKREMYRALQVGADRQCLSNFFSC